MVPRQGRMSTSGRSPGASESRSPPRLCARKITEESEFGFFCDFEAGNGLDDGSRHNHGHLTALGLDDIYKGGVYQTGSDTDTPTHAASSRSASVSSENHMPSGAGESDHFPAAASDWDPDTLGEMRGRMRSQSAPEIHAGGAVGSAAWRRQSGPLGGGASARGQPEKVGCGGWGGLVSRSSVLQLPNHQSFTSTKTYELPSRSSEALDALSRHGVRVCGSAVGTQRVTVTVHISGFRVVPGGCFQRHAEYQVWMTVGGNRRVKWCRFTDFKLLAACVTKDRRAAQNAWALVVNSKPGFRCLRPGYLSRKCRLLENFLQNVMFASETPILLLNFVGRQD